VRLFAKPEAFVRRRMGVALAAAETVAEAKSKAVEAAGRIKVGLS
jgi:phosphoribosylglycinamide formyltransferase 2